MVSLYRGFAIFLQSAYFQREQRQPRRVRGRQMVSTQELGRLGTGTWPGNTGVSTRSYCYVIRGDQSAFRISAAAWRED